MSQGPALRRLSTTWVFGADQHFVTGYGARKKQQMTGKWVPRVLNPPYNVFHLGGWYESCEAIVS
jgi:hypothetical protein